MSNNIAQSVVDLLPDTPCCSLCTWIGGEPVPPEGNAYLKNIHPATGRVLSQIPRSQELDIHAVFFGVQRLYKKRKRSSYSERADLLDAIANRLEERKEEFAQAESLDTGKPFHIAKNVDISRAIANFRFFAGAIRHDETGCHIMADAINYTIRNPWVWWHSLRLGIYRFIFSVGNLLLRLRWEIPSLPNLLS